MTHTLGCAADWWRSQLLKRGVPEEQADMTCHCDRFTRWALTHDLDERIGYERAAFRNRRNVVRHGLGIDVHGDVPYAYHGWRGQAGEWLMSADA